MVKTNQNLAALFDAFRDEFMQPEIESGMFAEVTTYGVGDLVPLPYLDDDMRPNVTDLHVGYFARLSAPGYMDSTEWSGPFAHEIEAIDYLIDTYADGMGDDEEE